MLLRSSQWSKLTVPLVLLTTFLFVVLIAGGSSRGDAFSQVFVRMAAIFALVVSILFGPRPVLGTARPVLLLLTAALLLALLQLVPLPPDLWQSLPGRKIFAEAASMSGQDQPWRPWTIVPGATINAAGSLLVPITMLVLVLQLQPREKQSLPGLVLLLIVGSTLVGLLQISGISFNNLLIKDEVGQVSGTFANRNHFALFLAFGCMLAPVWAFLDGRLPRWRGPVAFGLVLLFALTILASGSRAGLVLGAVGLAVGLVLVRQSIRLSLNRFPRWVFPLLLVGIIAVVTSFILISVAAGRAVSIQRLLTTETGEDMRSRALPTVLNMIEIYFPMGSGLGAFDPIFRVHEPDNLLQLSYFNHAHNDFLEIVLDAGIFGLLLLAVGLLWWILTSFRVWRAASNVRNALPKIGSVMLLLVMIASVVDYPARTPLIMAMIVLAGIWLSDPLTVPPKSGLLT